MVAGQLNKYIWLINKLISAGERGMTLEEISSAWAGWFGGDYARSSFNNHRKGIADLFGIEIECNRSTNRYFIRHADDITDSQANTAWIIDTFTVNNILTLGKERLSGRVSVEAVPSGRKFLTPLVSALQNNNTVSLVYKKYGGEPESLNVHPYAVKESMQRWYLIGYCEERQGLRVYSLDRIAELKVLTGTFKMPENFDSDELFATSFGPYLSDNKGIWIEFKAFGKEASFIRDLPIHKSQEEIVTEKDFSIFRIFVSPNISMYMEFLKHGPAVEILSPPHVRETLVEKIEEMNKLYQ